jgi:hypothetical protein
LCLIQESVMLDIGATEGQKLPEAKTQPPG